MRLKNEVWLFYWPYYNPTFMCFWPFFDFYRRFASRLKAQTSMGELCLMYVKYAHVLHTYLRNTPILYFGHYIPTFRTYLGQYAIEIQLNEFYYRWRMMEFCQEFYCIFVGFVPTYRFNLISHSQVGLAYVTHLQFRSLISVICSLQP